MNRFLLTILAVLIAGVASAQTPMMYEQEALNMLNSKMFAKNLDSKTSDYPSDFSKNTLAFENWYYGSIKFTDDSTLDSLRFNYDFNVQALVIQFNLDISAISLVSDLVNSFYFEDEGRKRNFIKLGKSSFADIDYGMPFFELIHGSEETPFTLVKQFRKSLNSADQQVTYGGEVAEDKFELDTYYFIKAPGDKKYKRIVLNKKRIIDVIGKSQAKAVQKYVKENRLKWNNEQDAAQILANFLN